MWTKASWNGRHSHTVLQHRCLAQMIWRCIYVGIWVHLKSLRYQSNLLNGTPVWAVLLSKRTSVWTKPLQAWPLPEQNSYQTWHLSKQSSIPWPSLTPSHCSAFKAISKHFNFKTFISKPWVRKTEKNIFFRCIALSTLTLLSSWPTRLLYEPQRIRSVRPKLIRSVGSNHSPQRGNTSICTKH